jgi:outer membrane protein assembly factor BamB
MTKKVLFSFLLLIIPGIITLNAQQLQKIWETSEGLKTPESVLYNEQLDVIYVANINDNPAEKDGNGFISILNPNGEIINPEWIKKLNAPKGMAIFNGKLYVADIDQLVEIDIEKGKISKRYEAPGAVFLNDVTACLNGMIFVSDTRTAKIHVLHQGEFKIWMEGKPFKSPNGLLAEKGKLYVGDENIYEVDILTQKVELLIENTGGVDGLIKNNEGEFVFSNWPGRIYIFRNGESIKLLDSTDQSINTADIGFVPKFNLVLVPTFFNNRVVAYKIVH